MHFRKELVQAISELEIRATQNVAALLAGNYRTSFRGSGMQFKEFRHYESGDDIRHMSWTVTARTGRATVKVYEEEREINVVLLVDTSGSSMLHGHGRGRREMYAELMALLGLAALKSGDNVGALFFDTTPSHYLAPKRSKDQVLSSLHHLLSLPIDGKQSDLRPSLTYLLNVLKTRSLVIVLSDFLVPKFDTELLALSKRHEVILLRCYDDLERGFGMKGVYEVRDPETNQFFLLDGRSKKNQKLLAECQNRQNQQLEDMAQKARADYLPLSVEDDYLHRLVRFFRERGPSRL